MAGEPITFGEWSTTTSTPLDDFKAVAAFIRSKGLPVMMNAQAVISPADYNLLSGKPLSCDLSADPLACAILRQWARQPWNEVHRMALVDRMEEAGRTAEETAWARKTPSVVQTQEGGVFWPARRTRRRQWVRCWTQQLVDQFGDFEANTLVCGTEDTPQGG